MNSNIEKSDKPSFIKISEQPSLYDDLEKKSVREILEDINKGRPESSYCRTESNSSNRETSHKIVPRMKQGTHFLYGSRHQRTPQYSTLQKSHLPSVCPPH